MERDTIETVCQRHCFKTDFGNSLPTKSPISKQGQVQSSTDILSEQAAMRNLQFYGRSHLFVPTIPRGTSWVQLISN